MGGLSGSLRAESTGQSDFVEVPVSADTSLMEWTPDFNLGGQSDLPAGTLGANAGTMRSRVLLRFDLREFPAGLRVESAFVRWEVTREPVVPPVASFGLHRVLVGWEEGQGSGNLPGGERAVAGESTWGSQAFGTSNWSEPGMGSGVDYEVLPDATEEVSGLGMYEFEVGAQGVATVQGWIEDPSRNHGWLLRTDDESVARSARRWGSREGGKGAVLRMRVTGMEMAPRFTGIEVMGDEVRLRFVGANGVTYDMQATAEPGAAEWPVIETLPPVEGGEERMVTLTGPLAAQQYYRLFRRPRRARGVRRRLRPSWAR
jgi:hypothetical protein